VSGGTGSLEFVLSGAFRELAISVGFSDRVGSTTHFVKFDVVFDDKEHLEEAQTLRFGDIRHLRVDVTGVTRLTLVVEELASTRGSGAPSNPAFAGLRLTPM
jgi:hypothetical protein